MNLKQLKLEMNTILGAVADLALPRVCVVCGRSLTLSEEVICLPCLEDLPQSYLWLQSHNTMADEFNARISGRTPGFEPYSYACALYFYVPGSLYNNISIALKYKRNFAAGEFFASMLAKRICEAPHFADVDAVVPVPLHWTRRWKRGYNQAELIASAIARELHAPLMPQLLVRKHRTNTQTRLGSEAKGANVKGAFCSGKRVPGLRHILLVDDVYTTGATLAECHHALRKVYDGKLRISVATLAYYHD